MLVFKVVSARKHLAETLGKAFDCVLISVASKVREDTELLDDQDMDVIVGEGLRSRVNLCCLDARMFTTIRAMVDIIRQVGELKLIFVYTECLESW